MNIALLGFGTVGSGVYEIVKENQRAIEEKTGQAIRIKYIVELRDFSGHPDSALFTSDFEQVLADSDVSVIAEMVGGTKPAYEFTKRALLAKKHVVTSNKELVATHGTELLQIAKENNVNYMFEASVGGGIPVIRPLNNCLAANNIKEIMGILNGTTNFILTKMFSDNESFEDALRLAQKLGYAEANPDADVLGYDAQRKICILSALAFGKCVNLQDILCEGITGITKEDVAYAEKLGTVIKLIGTSTLIDGKICARVSPMMIETTDPLGTVSDVFNAVKITGDYVGTTMFYGRGAGKLPTASAVMGDIIDIAKDSSHKGIMWKDGKDVSISSDEAVTAWFIRSRSSKENVKAVFDQAEFIDAISDETAFIIPAQKEKETLQKLKAITVISKIRLSRITA